MLRIVTANSTYIYIFITEGELNGNFFIEKFSLLKMKKTPSKPNGFNVVTENKYKNLTYSYMFNICRFI